jgi:hypothetical protein
VHPLWNFYGRWALPAGIAIRVGSSYFRGGTAPLTQQGYPTRAGTRPTPVRAWHSTSVSVITQWISHMATRSEQIRIGIQVVLGVAIIGLGYFLYYSITEPYERIERQQERIEKTRARMDNIRTAIIDYERDSTSFPDSLDILRTHIQRDSILATQQDSIFGGPVNLDALFYSARSGERFQYALSDTGRVETYLLEDPASSDKIGTLTGDPTMANSASWE